jgi:hypothetical protein
MQNLSANPLISLTPAYTCELSNATSGQYLFLHFSAVKLWSHPQQPRNQRFAKAHPTGVSKQ